MFVTAGTKIRVRTVGDRAEFCPGCLQPTRFSVKTLQTASHLCGVALGYTNDTVYGECTVCGARIEPMFHEALVPTGTLSYESLLEQTNPRLTPERIAVLLDVAGDAPMRQEQSLHYFLAKQEALLVKEGGRFGGGVLFVFLTLLLVLFGAFHGCGVVAGMACAVVAVVTVFLAHRLEVRHRVARVIRPSLQRYLASQGISFDELEQALRSPGFQFPKLERHLASSPYDAMRMDSARSPVMPEDIACQLFRPRKQVGLA